MTTGDRSPRASEPTTVSLAKAKGRPMLSWVGKRPLRKVRALNLIDVPGRRADLMEGAYDLEAPAGAKPAAVRITDMLGEEILVVEQR